MEDDLDPHVVALVFLGINHHSASTNIFGKIKEFTSTNEKEEERVTYRDKNTARFSIFNT